MNVIKAVAYAVVILGSGYLGMLLASRLDTRVRQLEAFQEALTQLSFHIGFLHLPIREAMTRVERSQRGVIRRIFAEAADYLDSIPGSSVAQAWTAALEKNQKELCLNNEEVETLREFAVHVGHGETEGELNNIRLTCAKLKLAQDTAQAEQQKDAKLYRGLGLLGGMLVVILLF